MNKDSLHVGMVPKLSGSSQDHFLVHCLDDETDHISKGILTFRFDSKKAEKTAGVIVPAPLPPGILLMDLNLRGIFIFRK